MLDSIRRFMLTDIFFAGVLFYIAITPYFVALRHTSAKTRQGDFVNPVIYVDQIGRYVILTCLVLFLIDLACRGKRTEHYLLTLGTTIAASGIFSYLLYTLIKML